jgi:hypothetical protein
VVYADDVNTYIGWKRNTIKKNTVALVFTSKEIRLKVMLIKLSNWLCQEIRTQDEAGI